jgi:hypothetical protein
MAILIKKQDAAVSWAEVAEHIRNGEGIPVGTVIRDTLKDGRAFSVVAVHNDPYHINETAFVFLKAPFRKQMNSEYTNAGGWKASEVREELKEFFELLPDDLQAVIKKKKTVQIIGGEKVKCKDKLWIPTEYEMFGECYYSEQTETDTVQFDYFKDRKNRMIAVDGEDDYAFIWLASPCSSNTTNFCYVSNYGGASGNNASNSYGVAPGFTIR